MPHIRWGAAQHRGSIQASRLAASGLKLTPPKLFIGFLNIVFRETKEWLKKVNGTKSSPKKPFMCDDNNCFHLMRPKRLTMEPHVFDFCCQLIDQNAKKYCCIFFSPDHPSRIARMSRIMGK